MEVIPKFILWFIVCLVSIFFVETIISNPFTKSFILSLVISVLLTKDLK